MTRFSPNLVDLERDIQVLCQIYINVLKMLFLVLTLLKNKELETSQDLFEFKAGPSKPHSQIWGEIVTYLVKIPLGNRVRVDAYDREAYRDLFLSLR